MVFKVKSYKGREYLYYQAGKKAIYIGPKGNPTKVKVENLLLALDHSTGRVHHYLETLDDLLALLPGPLSAQDLKDRITTLQEELAEYGKATR